MTVRTFADLLGEHEQASIRCLLKRTVVRRLSKDVSGNIVLEPLQGPTLVVPGATPIMHEPWVFDRGNLVFRHEDVPGKLKLCTVYDIIAFEDGTEESLEPADTEDE